MSDPAIVRFRALVEAGLAALEARRQEVNDLNVFPVADGDTGDNMVLTLRAVLDELDRILEASAEHTLDEIGREEIVGSVARAALLGARGNSGVILSQLIRGAAEELISRPGELIDPVLIGAALARAADQAYGSVRNPAEGTILTVVREMASRVATELAHMSEPRLGPDAPAEVQDALAADVMERALDAGQQSVKRGPDLLPVLREAGVVDAGGYGLTVVLAGMVQGLRGGETIALEHHAPARVTRPEHASTTFRYCTNFAVTGRDLDARGFTEELERLGDSVLCVGDQATLKVHVHTDAPDAAMALFAPHHVSHIDIADMSEQVRDRDARLTLPGSVVVAAPVAGARCGGLAVVTGEGLREHFLGLGVSALDGGSTLNPSTNELLAAIHAVPCEDVVLLPNSSNVVMAAERAAQLSEKNVVVVASRTLQAGLAAAVALDPQRSAPENAAAMARVLAALRTGAVARAARDDTAGRFRAGEAIGFVDEELVAWGSPEATLREVIGRLAGDAELITCLRGIDAPLEDAAVRDLADGEVEFELSAGGQESYWWLLSAE
ncbi:MAG TPA: DAK2 domain-containing protein [Solirubrobacteraceae bacterium]|nr:DAK2 domain-containing protein [Solirubrobacteraceae bacterium]